LSTTYYLLRNRAYCGDVVIGRRDGKPEALEIVEDSHEALIDRSVFSRVQAILDARAESHAIARWESSPYLLSGLLRCGLCGRHMAGTSAKSGKYHYYTCQQYCQEGKTACAGVRVSKREIEELVMSRARDLILSESNLRLLVQLVNERLSQLQIDEKALLEGAQQRITGLRKRLQRNYEALESGLLDLEELAPRIRELRQDIRDAERDQDKIAARQSEREATAVTLEAVIPYAQKLRSTLQIGSFRERKKFLAGLISCVHVGRESVEIEYRLPLPQHETEELGSPVLHAVASGGGGGSRTRVRRYRRSASTSLVPCFGLGGASSHDPDEAHPAF